MLNTRPSRCNTYITSGLQTDYTAVTATMHHRTIKCTNTQLFSTSSWWHVNGKQPLLKSYITLTVVVANTNIITVLVTLVTTAMLYARFRNFTLHTLSWCQLVYPFQSSLILIPLKESIGFHSRWTQKIIQQNNARTTGCNTNDLSKAELLTTE